MSEYRRNRVPGGTYFFTTNLRSRQSDLLVRYIGALRNAVRGARERQAFHIDAWVVLPDHMHCIWTLPQGDCDFPGRWQTIKIAFSKSLPASESLPDDSCRRRERGVWQRRYWEHTIRDDRDYAAHMDYVHFNPVKHRLARDAASWPYSTFGRCVRRGLYPVDWAGQDVRLGEAGERRDEPGF